MKKIIIDKEEGIAEVIDEILNEPDPEVTLVIPKGSALGRTVSNFHLLKREADAAEKTVVIESVDEAILAFAKESDLESSHPLWRGARSAVVAGAVSDIVPKSRRSSPLSASRATPKRKPEPAEEPEIAGEESEIEEEQGSEPVVEDQVKRPFWGISRSPRGYDEDAHLGGGDNDDNGDEKGDDDDLPHRHGISGKVWTTIAVVVVLMLGGAYIASVYFNHATISISFKKTAWNWQGALVADKSVSTDDFANGVLAGQVFLSSKNVTQTFRASSQQNVSLKAQGTITIYNNYSTSPQELVATTRFLTPDGKIFRITQNVTVPGATKAGNGTLTPSSINAPVVADQPGPAYNIGPVAKLTIPGFAGKPQAVGFYGSIVAPTTGGFTGTRAVPTAADIAAAEASTTAALRASLEGGFSGSYPNNFKILDGATNIQVGKLVVNTTTDEQGDFSVFGSATLSAIGFDEVALRDALLSQAQGQSPSSTFHDINLNYSNIQAAFSKGQISFTVAAQGDLEPAFSTIVFEQQILGKDITVARSTIGALPQLSGGEISVWPLWLWTIPSDPAKLKINVD